jgi:N-acetylglucosamine-6-phosphate deacetylase
MKTLALRGNVVTDYEVWEDATVVIEGAAVLGITREPVDADEVYEFPRGYLVPGFVDLQVNGSFGVDVATQPERLPELSRKLPATGITSYLPTLISLPRDAYSDLLPRLERDSSGGAEVLGVHLEGPFLNPEKAGAHPAANIVAPDVGLLGELLDVAPVRLLTLAPEREGASELVSLAEGRGVVLSAGHTAADFETAYRALDFGLAGVTHLFNAMTPLHHREPGVPGAAFAHPRAVCGLITDGFHVHPEVVGLALRMLGPDRIYLTTDAIAAAGMGPGEYSLAGQPVRLREGVPRLESGEIAGSLLTMNEALKNVLAFTGCTMAEAVRMAAATPARLIGEGERKGRLAPGYDADVVALSPGMDVEAVWVRGERVR